MKICGRSSVTEGSFSDCNLDPIVRNIYAAFIALFEIGGIAEFVYRLSGVKDGKASAITDETWLIRKHVGVGSLSNF